MPIHTPSKLLILVGTVTGTALQVAQTIELGCADLIAAIEVRPMDGLDHRVFDEDALFLICTSTHGAGDVPDNARALFDSLAIEPRFLGHVRYGVVALGDSASHPHTFCNGGLSFDERLSDLGAIRQGEICRLDAASGLEPENEGLAWCRAWLHSLLAQPA